MKLNQSKCILLGMNSLGSAQYLDGGFMPMADRGTVFRNEYVSKGEPSFRDKYENNKHHNNIK